MAERIAVIGAGPAGIACSVQLKRCGLNPVIFEGGEIGGTIRQASLVENYPGFPDGIRGLDLGILLKAQTSNWSFDILNKFITSVGFREGCFVVETGQECYRFDTVVVATGSFPVELDEKTVPPDCRGMVFYDVLKARKANPEVTAIIGSGDVAFDWAITMAQNSSVTVFHRGPEPKCIRLLMERADGAGVKCGQATLHSVSRRDERLCLDFGSLQFQADALLPAIGKTPRNILDRYTLEKEEELRRDGRLFFIGDVRNERRRQVAIAAGDGLRAAMEIAERC